jgi:signal peptidase I
VRPWLAGLLNAILPGLGFLYLCRPVAAVGFWGSFPLLFVAASLLRLPVFPAGYLALLLSGALLWIGGIAAAIFLARNPGPRAWSAWQRRTAYAAFIAATVLVSIFVGEYPIEHRGRLFGFESYRMASKSMMDTLLPGDVVVVDTWYYRDRPIARGDVVAILPPHAPQTPYIERVIGLPGEQIAIGQGAVRIGDEILDEPYSHQERFQRASPAPGCDFIHFDPIPDGQLVVLGDYRDTSNDSRCWGLLATRGILGRVQFVSFSVAPDSGVRWHRILQQVR